MELSELKIDPEFESNNPKLTDEERKQLEENILADGMVFTPLIVWKKTIVDGHNRYHILQKYPEIPFLVKEMDFTDRYSAIVWICRNQLGRRNLTPEQKKFLIGKQYESEKKRHGIGQHRDEKGQFHRCTQNEYNGRTRDRIAEENGISGCQVQRNEDYVKGIEAAEDIIPGIKDKILAREIKTKSQDVIAVGKASPEERKQLVEELQKPKEKVKHEKKLPVEMEVVESPDVVENFVEMVKESYATDGIIEGSAEDMLCEMEDALDDLIWRWKNCRETYPTVLVSDEGKKIVKELAQEGLDFLNKVEKGELWNEE